MDFLQIVVLAVVQGLTEFLPVSSSAHLVLVPWVTSWEDQGLAFDVAVHLGTLLAVVYYFRNDLKRMSVAWFSSFGGDSNSADARLGWMIVIATVPAVIAGLLFSDVVETYARSPMVIAVMTIVFGLLLLFADKLGKRERDEYSIGIVEALIIGAAQAVALVPGTSRSGVTITAALTLGLNRQAAARFSFLMSIPIILAALLFLLWSMHRESIPIQWSAMAAGILLSAISAYLCIHYFLRLLEKIGMLPFVIYRLLLGLVLIFLVY